MNKRFIELAEQAGFVYNFDPVTWMKHEKFAELIITECANICFSEAEGHGMAFGEHCAIVIKEHFGVEG